METAQVDWSRGDRALLISMGRIRPAVTGVTIYHAYRLQSCSRFIIIDGEVTCCLDIMCRGDNIVGFLKDPYTFV